MREHLLDVLSLDLPFMLTCYSKQQESLQEGPSTIDYSAIVYTCIGLFNKSAFTLVVNITHRADFYFRYRPVYLCKVI